MRSREEIVGLDKQLLWHPYTPMRRYLDEVDPVVVARAEGVHLFDRNGQRLFDANGSWWVSILGHNHPRLMEALRRQTGSLAHCALAGMVHEPAVALAEKLKPLLGPPLARFFYSDDGSTAVELALRMAHQYWQNVGRPEKQRLVTLSGAFHGETIGAASVSAAAVFHEALKPLLFDVLRLPSPALARHEGEAPWFETAFAEAELLLRHKAREIAALIVEPLVQGAAGMLIYPPAYLARLKALCDELDILLICDEVFVGYGRTGTFLAEHQAGVGADIVCLGKGFSGGVLPMAATVASERVFAAFLGGPETTLWYGHSFTGNPLGCAVGLETLAVIEEERLLETQPARSNHLATRLARTARHPWVRDPRQAGLIAAFTLAPPDATSGAGDYLSTAGWRLHAAARRLGALLRPLGNVIYCVLPLNVTRAEIDELFDIVDAALEEVFR